MRIIKRRLIDDFEKTKTFSEQIKPVFETRVITITSGKGGVGKTNLAVNLAISLAQKGSRVILLDADLGLANVDVLLGVAPPLTLYDYLYRGVSIEDILYPGPGGIKIISGGSGIFELAQLTLNERSRLIMNLSKLEQLADLVLIDTGAGISKDVLAFCAAADEVYLVINPEPTSLTDAYALIKVLDRFDLHREAYFFVNQSRSDKETKDTIYRLESIVNKYLNINIKYMGDIAYDQSVLKAVKNQKPFLLAAPDSRASRDIKKIAYSVLKKEWNNNEDESGLQGFISKLSRLFR